MAESKTRDVASYADKAPSANHKALAAWITEQTGVKVDVKSVSLAVLLVHEWQKSPEGKAHRVALAKDSKEAVAAKKATTAAKKTAAPAKKAAAKKTAAPAKEASVLAGGAAKKTAPAKKKAGALKAAGPVF